eukprot:8372010-Pyramimonas_sp.AAC.1
MERKAGGTLGQGHFLQHPTQGGGQGPKPETQTKTKPGRGQNRARTNREPLRSGRSGGRLGRRDLLRAFRNSLK